MYCIANSYPQVIQQGNIMGSTTYYVLLMVLAIAQLAFSTSVEYQPIKITVNEHFRNPSGQVKHKLSSLASNYIHQGAIFFLNPEVRLRSRSKKNPPYIEALIAAHHQKNVSVELENNPEIVHKKDIDTNNKKPTQPITADDVVETTITEKPLLETIEVIPAEPIFEPIELPASQPIEVVEIDFDPPSFVINDESIIHELGAIPEAPTLPPLSLKLIHPVISEEIKGEGPVPEKPIGFKDPVQIVSAMPPLSAVPIFQPFSVSKPKKSFIFPPGSEKRQHIPVFYLPRT